MPDYILGKDCKVFRNSGTYGTPVWAEIEIVKEVTLNLENAEWDGSVRGTGGVRQFAATLADWSAEFWLLERPAHTGYEALRDAFHNKTLLDMAFATGPIATAGTEYYRAEWGIFGFTRAEPLEEGVHRDVTAKPGISANDPVFTEVA